MPNGLKGFEKRLVLLPPQFPARTESQALPSNFFMVGGELRQMHAAQYPKPQNKSAGARFFYDCGDRNKGEIPWIYCPEISPIEFHQAY